MVLRLSSSKAAIALLAVGLWSTNAWAAGVALSAMSVGWLLLVQYATACAALLTVRGLRRARSRRRRSDRTASPSDPVGAAPPGAVAVGVVGLTGTIFLQYLAFAAAPIVAASVLAYAWPLLAAVWVAGRLRTGRSAVLAGLALLGFAGVALIFAGPGAGPDGDGAGGAAGWGYAAALGSAACMAFYTLASSRRTTGGAGLLVPATVVGAAAAGVLTAATHPAWPEAVGWLAAAYVGLGPMAAGYGLWTAAMSAGGADRLAPIGYATPLLSTVLLLLTGSPAGTTTVLGVGLVLACSLGVVVTDRVSGPGRGAEVTDVPGPRAGATAPTSGSGGASRDGGATEGAPGQSSPR